MSGYPEDLPNLYGVGMTQALEFAKSACSTAVCLNSALMDFYRHFFWYPLGLEYWFEGQNQAFAQWMELGTQWMGVFSPQTERTSAHVVRRPRNWREKEDMEEGMDVAVEAFEEEILA